MTDGRTAIDEQPSRTMAPVGMGCARLGEALDGPSWSDSVAMLRAAADGGITLFDTAGAYTSGTSERLLGQAIAGRPDVTIATKAGYVFRSRSLAEARLRHLAAPLMRRASERTLSAATITTQNYAQQDFSPAHLAAAVDASCRRLGVESLPLLQLHAPRSAQTEVVAGWMDGVQRSGRVQRFGVATEDAAEATPWLGRDQIDSVQVHFSVFDVASSAAVMHRASGDGLEVMVRGVFGARSLEQPADASTDPRLAALQRLAAASGRTARELAVNYVRSQPSVGSVIVGARLPWQVRELVSIAHSAPLDGDLLAELEAVTTLD